MDQPWGKDLAAAKALFLAHDGSRFHLAREGRQAELDAFRVPDATLAEWRRELIGLRLSELGGESGWWAIHSLLDHRELGHLAAVVEHPPALGEPWHRRAYVQQALAYWDACAGWDASTGPSAASGDDREVLTEALRWILDQAQQLRASYRMRSQHEALSEVVQAAHGRLASLGAPTD